MTTATFIPDSMNNFANWNDPARWSTGVVPNDPAVDVTLPLTTVGGNPYSSFITEAGSYAVGSLAIDQANDLDVNGTLTVTHNVNVNTGGSIRIAGGLSVGTTLTVDGSLALFSAATLNATQLTVDAGGVVGVFGANLGGPILDNGRMYFYSASGSNSSAPIVLSGPVSGSGTLEIGSADATHAAVQLELGAAASSNVIFYDGQGTLTLDDPAHFSGTIAPAAAGDQIILRGISTVTGYNYSGDANGGTLAIHTTGGETDLHFLGNFVSSDFAFASNAGSLIITNVSSAAPHVLAPIVENSAASLITQAELVTNFAGSSPVASGLMITSGNGSLVDNHNGTWSYTPAHNDHSAVTFSYQVNYSGGVVAESATLAIKGPPVNMLPGALSVLHDQDQAVTGLSVTDFDATSLTVTLHVDHGTLAVGALFGTMVGGSGTSTVTLTGNVTQINGALEAANNVLYHGTSGFIGIDHVTMTSNDGGSNGVGVPLSATDKASINVLGNINFSDFDGDHKADILWQTDNGLVTVWDNGQFGSQHIVTGSVPSSWHIVGNGDFEGNGHGDILWQADDGTVAIWDNGQPSGGHVVANAGAVPSNWHIAGTGDFDGNGRTDILWQADDGTVAIWNNGMASGGHVVANAGAIPSNWHIAGTGDFDGNGRSDILWRADDGTVAIWNNGMASGGHVVANAGAVPSNWHIAGTGDFNGNGHSDILWQADDGTVAVWNNGQANGGHVIANAGAIPGNWHIAGVGDFDGNGRSDILWHSDNGTVAIWDNGLPSGGHVVATVTSDWHIV